MINFILHRMIHSIFVVLGLSIVVFMLIFAAGDPARLLLPLEAGIEEIQAFRSQMGWDLPIHIQYWHFLKNAIRGDFGLSLRHNQPALVLVINRLPATFKLTVISMAIALFIATPIGIISAVRKNSIFDAAAMLFALFGQSMPIFWLGINLILIFSVVMGWFPAGGMGSWRHLVLPAFTLGTYCSAIIARLLRSSMLEVLAQDYIRTARAKGLTEKIVIFRHALKNATISVVTIVGIQIGFLLGGAVIVEQVFSYAGMGRLAFQAIANRDIFVVEAFVFVVAIIVLSINLIIDIFYTFLDPRIRFD